jgi:hypothetical protein
VTRSISTRTGAAAWLSTATGCALVWLLGACSSPSNSITTSSSGGQDSEATGGGVDSPTGGGQAASSTVPGGGTSLGGGGWGAANPGTAGGSISPGGSGGTTTPSGGGGSVTPSGCTATTWTEGVHLVLKATWAANSAGVAGTGDIFVWALTQLTVSGNALSGKLRACGTQLPPATLNAAGQLVTGGTKILVEIPDSVWDGPGMLGADVTGQQSGTDASSTIQYAFSSLIGLTLPDPNQAWPSSTAGLSTSDVDGDGLPGFTAIPKKGDGFVLPPTGLGLLGSAPSADQVYLVSRNNMSLSGTRTSCDAHSGTADVTAFDNHVIGCHTAGGECTASQTDFCDQNRMIYQIRSATYEARRLADTATCADVHATFP